MAYCSLQDLIERYGETELIQLTDRAAIPPATIDADVVARAIGDASALVDGYLAKRYVLPLATVPDILVRRTAEIARHYLHGSAADVDGPVARGHRDAIAWLRDVAAGVVVLDVAGVTAPLAGGGDVRVTGPDRTLTRDSLRGL